MPKKNWNAADDIPAIKQYLRNAPKPLFNGQGDVDVNAIVQRLWVDVANSIIQGRVFDGVDDDGMRQIENNVIDAWIDQHLTAAGRKRLMTALRVNKHRNQSQGDDRAVQLAKLLDGFTEAEIDTALRYRNA